MPFEKGNRANPGGRPKDKPFRDALRMELAGAQGDFRELRRIARNLIKQANVDDTAALPAIREIGDRLDGKADAKVTIERSEFEKMSDSELREFIARTLAELGSATSVGTEETAGSRRLN